MPDPTPPAESCALCRFSLEDDGSLFCRRQPPQLVVLTSTGFGIGSTEHVRARFPLVAGTDWCGEYQSAPAAEVSRG
jgi:hypothetical protein